MTEDTIRVFDRSAAGDTGSAGGAWDDAELIAAWNAQLQRISSSGNHGTSTTIPPPAAATSEEDDEVCSDEEEGDDESALTSSAEAEVSQQPARKRPRCDVSETARSENLVPPMPPGVPREVHALLRSWFLAGFETGRFVAAELRK